jgi:hypothetical protein
MYLLLVLVGHRGTAIPSNEARGIRVFTISASFFSNRFLEPPIECFKKLTHFLEFLIPSREVVSLSLVFFQTIEFRLVLLHGMDEWN